MLKDIYRDKLHQLLYDFSKLDRNDVVGIRKPTWNIRWHIMCVEYANGSTDVWMEKQTKEEGYDVEHCCLKQKTKMERIVYLMGYYGELGITNISRIVDCSPAYARKVIRKWRKKK